MPIIAMMGFFIANKNVIERSDTFYCFVHNNQTYACLFKRKSSFLTIFLIC